VGLATQLPVSWTARKFVGSTPRRLATPSTGSPPTADLTRRLKDLQDTPPPALLPPICLEFHGPALDTSMQAEEVASRNTMEEEMGEGLAGAEQAGGGPEAEEALEEEMAGGGHGVEGAFEEDMAGGGEEAEGALEEDHQEGAGFLPPPVENHWLTQRVSKPARRRRLLSQSKVRLQEELAQMRRQGLRSACKPRRGEEEEDSQEGRG
jgi:hypothetical protein